MKKSLLLAGMMMLAVGAMAQENGNRDAENKIVRGPYQTNRFFDNIFIGAGAGVNIFEGENHDYGDFKNRIAPTFDVYVGKWITPSVGVRVAFSESQAKGWTKVGAYKKGADGSMFKEKFGVSFIRGEFMWNFSNAVSGYKETRTWNFIPFIGAGVARSHGNGTDKNELAVSFGLLNNIRLCDLLDLTLEARQMIVNQDLRQDPAASGCEIEGMSSLTVGLAFKLNRRGFKRVEPQIVPDYSKYEDKINALENDNNVLSSNNKNLAAENEALRNRKPAEVASPTATPVALFFSLGKSTLDKKEMTNLEFYINNAMKLDKNKVFTLIGSADKATGTKEVNQKLSEARMQYVYDLLVNKYGISKDRLIMKAEGDTNNRYAEPELNRVVIVE